MAFQKILPRKSAVVFHDMVRVTRDYISFSDDLWKIMGSPETMDLYYEEESCRIGMKSSENNDGHSVSNRNGSHVKQVYCKSFLNKANLFIEKPINHKIAHDPTGLYVFSMKG